VKSAPPAVVLAFALSLALALLAGCPARAAVPKLPSQGGPAWIELQSDHFTLWTDAKPERARTLMRQIEHLRQVLIAIGFDNATDLSRSMVFALGSRSEALEFIREGMRAYAVSSFNAPIRQPMMVMPADFDGDDAHVITHELIHVVTGNLIPGQPRWFAEGMAEFFASVGLDPDKAVVEVGRPSPEIVRTLRNYRPLPVAQMLACTGGDCTNWDFYVSAWAMFAYLANQRTQDLIAYTTRLYALPVTPEGRDQAWRETFPDLTPATFDHELRKWIAYGKYGVRRFELKLATPTFAERTLNDTDVLAARATLRQIITGRRVAQVPDELTAALAADPTHLLAQLVREGFHQETTVEEMHRLTAAHPDDWRSWMLLFLAAKGGPEAAPAKQQACALLATRTEAFLRDWCDSKGTDAPGRPSPPPVPPPPS
jgi:hypothetical protein